MSAEGVQRVEQLLQAVSDVVEPGDGLGAARHPGMVVAKLLLGGFKPQPLLLYKECDHPQFLHIRRGVETYPRPVPPWRYYGETAFPEAQGGGGEADHLGHL